jgi:hypothetical protein
MVLAASCVSLFSSCVSSLSVSLISFSICLSCLSICVWPACSGYQNIFHDYGEAMQVCPHGSVLSGCKGEASDAPCDLALCRALCSADDLCNFLTYTAGDGPNTGTCLSANECASLNDVASKDGDIYHTYSKGPACLQPTATHYYRLC